MILKPRLKTKKNKSTPLILMQFMHIKKFNDKKITHNIDVFPCSKKNNKHLQSVANKNKHCPTLLFTPTDLHFIYMC